MTRLMRPPEPQTTEEYCSRWLYAVLLKSVERCNHVKAELFYARLVFLSFYAGRIVYAMWIGDFGRAVHEVIGVAAVSAIVWFFGRR